MKIFATLTTLLCAATAFAIKTTDLSWHDMKEYPLYGTLAHDTKVPYSRLPDSLHGVIREPLWDLGKNSAGMYIRFSTDASAIGAKWKATKKFNMNHMTAAGIRGLDLYVLDSDNAWTTVSSARPVFGSHNTTTMVVTDMLPVMREYMLYLPLYDGVDSIYIGIDSTAVLRQPSIDSPRAGNPVVMYGTSILQGGCASRPGMVHTSILSRMLNREVVNLGFSGNAQLDLQIAELMANSDASLFVIDALPNVKKEQLVERMKPFLATIRAKHPLTPVVLVESPMFPITRFNTETYNTITEKNKALHDIYSDLCPTDANLYYFRGEDILGDCVEGTVDNYHFTDMGFTQFAQAMYPLLRQLLKD